MGPALHRGQYGGVGDWSPFAEQLLQSGKATEFCAVIAYIYSEGAVGRFHAFRLSIEGTW